MVRFPIFLSLVFVLRNRSRELEHILRAAANIIAPLVSDYDIVIIDNASDDSSVSVLKSLTAEKGLPNLEVYALAKQVDADTASWVGLENALGDFIAVVDSTTDDITFLPTMLDQVVSGADVVFASNEIKPHRTLPYRVGSLVFDKLYKWFNGIQLVADAPHYRVLSRGVVNFILQHPQPALAYRHLPAAGGFVRAHLSYSAAPKHPKKRRLADSIDRGLRLLVCTTRAALRSVTTLSLFGAVANLVYSAYVILIAMFKTDVAAGWVTLSLQLSGMVFLISLVLLVLGEYILNMASLSNQGPLYHVAQEFTSAMMTRREKLNLELVETAPPKVVSSATGPNDGALCMTP